MLVWFFQGGFDAYSHGSLTRGLGTDREFSSRASPVLHPHSFSNMVLALLDGMTATNEVCCS